MGNKMGKSSTDQGFRKDKYYYRNDKPRSDIIIEHMHNGFIYNTGDRAFYYDELSSMEDAEEFLYHNFSYDIERRRKDVSYQDIWVGVQDLIKYFEIFGMGPMLRNILHLETIVETYRDVFHNQNFAVWNFGGIAKLFKNFLEKPRHL